MAYTPKILAFSGSLRKNSFNSVLVKIAAKGARDAGADVTVINLRDYPLPVFDEDLEAESGAPEACRKLQSLFLSHQGLLISCPEYNSSVTAALKNTLDWVSRAIPGELPLACFNGKVGTLMSASPGALGGLRGLVHVRAILSNLNVLLLPTQIAVSKAREAFNTDGTLKDIRQQTAVEKLGADLVLVLKKLNG